MKEHQILLSLPLSEFEQIQKGWIKDVITENYPPQEKKEIKIPEYLTRAETAKLLKISLPTLNEFTKSNILQGYKIGGRVLYKLIDIENSLQKIRSNKYRRNRISK